MDTMLKLGGAEVCVWIGSRQGERDDSSGQFSEMDVCGGCVKGEQVCAGGRWWGDSRVITCGDILALGFYRSPTA